MDWIQELLFGSYPRAVGVTTPELPTHDLKQYLVHSTSEFDGVLSQVSGTRNMYSSLSRYQPVEVDSTFEGCAVVGDKVSFDFDSAAKASEDEVPDWTPPEIPDHASDYDVVNLMRNSTEVAHTVLGDACKDVRRLATECINQGIPTIGVFSGFGIHVHQLYKPTPSRVGDKMGSMCRKWTADLKLSTADERASGKPFRIMRVPNVERICHADGDSRHTGLYTVPLTAEELSEVTPEWLLENSTTPRYDLGLEITGRHEMKVVEEYIGPGYQKGVGQEKMRPLPDSTNAERFARVIVEEVTKMPCVYERALGRNPPNDVRVKLGIMFLAHGYTPDEITDIISRLGWVDFDRDTTRYQLQKLRESGKGDWSCKTLMAKGLCVRADDPGSCPTYGYRGGNVPE